MLQRCSWFRLLLLAMTAALLQASPCLAFPPLPSSFYGKVKVNGSNVPAGTVVRAVIGGRTYAESYTQIYQGDSTFGLDVPGDDAGSSAVEGGREGESIHFEVGGLPALSPGVWHSGTNTRLDLAASGAVSLATVTPSPLPTHTSYPTPGPSPSVRPASPSTTRLPNPTPTRDAGLVPSPVSRALTPDARTPAVTSTPSGQTQTAMLTPAGQIPTAMPTPVGQIPTAAPVAGGWSAGPAGIASSATATLRSPPVAPAAGKEPVAPAQDTTRIATPAPAPARRANAGQPQPAPFLPPAALPVSAAPPPGQEADPLVAWRRWCLAGLATVAVAGFGVTGGLIWTLRRKK